MARTLLSVGTNHSLLGIRNLVLAKAGFEVIAAKSGAAAIKAIETSQLDAVIVGHSLSRALKEQITTVARAKSLPVVALHVNAFEAHVPNASANLCGIDGAAHILEVLNDLLAASKQLPISEAVAPDMKSASAF